jgi:GT2 family glycosyltransferase
MIAFGCAIADEEKYRRFALPGIERVREPESPLIELRGRTDIFSAYNEILDEVLADPRVDAVTLIHEDTEIRDSFFEEKVRWALNDPAVAIVGTIGSVGVQGIDWWVHDYGIGLSILEPIDAGVLYETPLLEGPETSGAGSSGEADMVDGYLMVLSRWAIHELRFDTEEVGPGFHGYDADICFQARERGRKVFAAEMVVAHHRNSVSPTPYREDWLRAQIAFRRKWERRGMLGPPRLPFPPYKKSKQEREQDERERG